MARTASVSEARTHFGALLQWAEETGEPVIVERRGRSVGVILSHATFEEMRAQQGRLRRHEAWAQLRRLQERLAAKTVELTEEEAETLVGRASKDIMQALIGKGEVHFADEDDRESGARQ